MTQGDALLLQAARNLDGPDDADDAIEAPAAGDGIGMRSDGERRQIACAAWAAPDQVGGLVHRDVQPGLLHPSRYLFPPLAIERSERAACVRLFRRRQPRQCLNVGLYPFGI